MYNTNITQNQMIGYWAKSKGISLKDLEGHKHIDDVILLLKIKDALGPQMSKSELASWGGIWSSVYVKRKKISKNGLRILANIGEKIKYRQTIIHKLRQKQGTTRTQNPGCNMTVNDPGIAYTS